MKQIIYNSPIKIGDTIRVGRPVIDAPVPVDYYTGRDEYVANAGYAGDTLEEVMKMVTRDNPDGYCFNINCQSDIKVWGLTKVNKDNTIASPNT